MPDFREVIFGQTTEAQKASSRRRWIALLVIAFLIGMAWHYGIITSAALLLKQLAVAIWNMLCDMADAVGDFLQYISRERSH